MTKTDLPQGGGSYRRDPKTGKLTQVQKPAKPAPAPDQPADEETAK